MDDFSRHVRGRRGAGCPCPCCVETRRKKVRSRLARSRLKQETTAIIRDETERDNNDPCD